MQPLEVSPNGLKFTLGLPIKVFLLITYQEKLLLNPDGNTPPPQIYLEITLTPTRPLRGDSYPKKINSIHL
jgi:hypothetical protein